jgi:hypothetical protein
MALAPCLVGEEQETAVRQVLRVVDVINAMPKTQETDGQGDAAVAFLHYYMGSLDIYVTERDVGDLPDSSEIGIQAQAFGKVSINGNGAKAQLG